MQREVIFSTIFMVFMVHSSSAICKRPEENKDWKRKSLIERAVEADIVIYGKVFYSPCWKAGYIKPSMIPTPSPISVTATNSSRNTTTASKEVNTTSSPTRPRAWNTSFPPTSLYKCSSSFYSATIQVYCVIKGGILPAFILLHGFGHGEAICLEETYHDYHAYRNLNYVIFIGREKEVNGTVGFWINSVNHQPAATEINDEDILKPLFEAVGRNARAPVGATARSKTEKEVCKPYESSAASWGCLFLSPTLMLLLFFSALQIN